MEHFAEIDDETGDVLTIFTLGRKFTEPPPKAARIFKKLSHDPDLLRAQMDDETEELDIPTNVALDATEVPISIKPKSAERIAARDNARIEAYLSDPIRRSLVKDQAAMRGFVGTPKQYIRSL